MLRTMLMGAVLLLTSLTLNASTFPVHISGNTAETTITLPGGFEVDVTLKFENVMGLSAKNLNISGYLADPLSLDVKSRLPDALIKQQAAFPLVVRIDPLANSGFSFSGPITIELHTHNLQYSVNTPLRLYKSHAGGAFEDITIATGAGSIRARGQMGHLSDFIIVADLRPVTQVVQQKAQKLEAMLDQFANQIAPELLVALQRSIGAVRTDVLAGRYKAALAELKQTQLLISNAGAGELPDVWRSARDIDNVAGMLAAASETLAYSLRLAL